MSYRSENLTIKQGAAIVALLACQTVAEAAKRAAVGQQSVYRWLRQGTFGSISVAPATKPSLRPSGACSRPSIAV